MAEGEKGEMSDTKDNVLTIEIPENLASYIQRLSYEVESMKGIVSLLMENNRHDASFIQTPVFKGYSKELAEATAAFELAKSELEKSFVPEKLKGHNFNWNLDFATYELTIEVLCDCGLEVLKKLND